MEVSFDPIYIQGLQDGEGGRAGWGGGALQRLSQHIYCTFASHCSMLHVKSYDAM